MGHHTMILTTVAGLWLATVSRAGTIVQDGSLSGSLGTTVHTIDLDRFDPALGTLDAVRLDVLTSVIGGGQTNGPGGPTVAIFAQLSADYALGAVPLAQTDAIVDTTIAQTGPPIAYSVFDTDTDLALLEPPADLAPWIGPGVVTLTARVTFGFSEDPPGETGFGAGGSASYTLTYEFTDDDPCAPDLDDDGNVGFADLSALLAAWGPCPGCPEDLDGDDNVGFADLNALLEAWGTCA